MAGHDHERRDGAVFWQSRCGRFTKELMLFGLVAAFLVQTCLVYTDAHDTVRLSPQQTAGRRVWHKNNCQTCHQFHGFGGFLGPDLTNATARLEREQLDTLLTVGSGQMPPFHMEADDIDAVWAYLGAMNETGIGQARNPNRVRPQDFGAGEGEHADVGATVATPAAALAQVIGETAGDSVAAGFETFRTNRCLTCHVLFARSSIGAPDLSVSGVRLADDELRAVLGQGRPPRMPRPALTGAERENVCAFIRFMAEHRSATLARVEPERQSFWSSLPWWEYR